MSNWTYQSLNNQITLYFTDVRTYGSPHGKISYKSNDLRYTGYMDYEWEPQSLTLHSILANPIGGGAGSILVYLAAAMAYDNYRPRVRLTSVNPLAYTFYVRMGFFATEGEIEDILARRGVNTYLPTDFHTRAALDFFKNNPRTIPGTPMRPYIWDGATLDVRNKAAQNLNQHWRQT